MPRTDKAFQKSVLICLVLVSAALFISYRRTSTTGPLWPDASQYANAGAMIHDYITSGNFIHPYLFAKENYYQYPAFHVPYHPPFYPILLGLFFLITGVGYQPARFFVALCLAIAAVFFYGILKKQGIRTTAAASGALFLITIPEVAFWSRDTMSEVPALALITVASYVFLDWLKTAKLASFLLALTLAECAFLSRYLTAGVLIAWLIWMLALANWRALITRSVALAAAGFLVLSFGWVIFALKFSNLETPLGGVRPITNYAPPFSPEPLVYQLVNLPVTIGWPVLLLATVGTAYLLYRRRYEQMILWVSWLCGYSVFLIAVGITSERRYFFFAIPAFAGLAAELLSAIETRKRGQTMLLVLVAACLAVNGYLIKTIPRGVVGYESVGSELAILPESGNVLVALREQADLIFRYRSYDPKSTRLFIRADRTLVIRPPNYANAQTVRIAHNNNDILQIIERGRIRYLVTCAPIQTSLDDRTEEMILLHNFAASDPQNFALVKSFPLIREYSRNNHLWQVSLWRYLGPLPQTPSELPVYIPSAEMEIKPSS